VGSVFSPYYAWSGRTHPENHCALNVALYGERGARWAMTERSAARVIREKETFCLNTSTIAWKNDTLAIDIDEIAAPLPRRLRGQVRVTPHALSRTAFALADAHMWQPIAPRAHVEVALTDPDLAWTGDGYLDSNWGGVPLESSFQSWTWSRAHMNDGAAVLYDCGHRDGTKTEMALRFDANAAPEETEPPPKTKLPATLWRITRETRGPAAVRNTLEDGPFYARTLLDADLFGERTIAFHESLDLDRFANPVVKAMLPFRMPRVFW
jgi:carotenoid 1,2-hydratase